MIDAYEIGIQLLLQEDVSAGLAVINRGLADVDRAIAATSVNLAALGQEAERVVKAVSAAVGVKAPQQATAEPKSTASTGDVAASATSKNSPLDQGDPAIDRLRQLGPEASASPSKATVAGDREPTQSSRVPSVPERNVEASSPTVAAAREIETPGQQSHVPLAKASDAPPSGRASDATSSLGPSPQQSNRELDIAAAGPKQGAAAPNPSLAVMAAVRHTRGSGSSPTVRSSPVRAQVADRFQGAQERVAAAPWSTLDRTTQQPTTIRPAERAAAPQSPGRDRTEGGGGTVMLDGRLVGQWLSEHMGREASRPPGGTSFFDARQTPAWTVSGAL